MTRTSKRLALSRRRFIQLAAVTGVVGMTGAAGYGAECSDRPAPYPVSTGSPADDAPPAPDAPILIALHTQSSNPFGPYLAEILRAEGLNGFRVARLDSVDRDVLSRFRVVLLSEGTLQTDRAALLRDYVAAGGSLIAMRPDAQLAATLGVTLASASISGGTLRTARHPICEGITSEGIQFHGDADSLRLDGAEAIARLESDTGAPLVTLHHAGSGKAAAWAFDLARSVALTRQGNPEWANQERDGLQGIRACDMFVGWMDLDRMEIPHADELQRLLANLINAMCAEACPLPRLWYFPPEAGAVLVATGDSHENIAPNVQKVIDRAERHGGLMSIYYTPPVIGCTHRLSRKVRWWASELPGVGDAIGAGYPLPSPYDVAAWRDRGHEFSMHPFVDGGLEQGYNAYWNNFVKFGYGPSSPTVRTHLILWTGWVETARVQSQYGVRMNVDYYHVGPAFIRADDRTAIGHFTGSGLPMKFVDEDGIVVDVYQQNTQLVDEHLLDALGGRARLTPEEAVAASESLMRLSLEKYPAALAAQFHVDPYEVGGAGAEAAARWMDGTFEYAASNGIPIVPTQEWLAFTETRHDAELSSVEWSADRNRLSFDLATRPASPSTPLRAGPGVEVMIPARHAGAALRQVQIDGQQAETRERRLGNTLYAAFRAPAGQHEVEAAYAA